jgi:outer membrane receptor protein involved in Fe transport
VQSSAGAATTGIYIDDTPIQTRHLSFGTFNAYPVLFDLGRVEVLRGPQGTLFGSGSEGGTVRFIMPEAQLTGESAYMRSGLASTSHGDPSYEVGAAYGAPISEGVLGYRASVSYPSQWRLHRSCGLPQPDRDRQGVQLGQCGDRASGAEVEGQ